jgi:hypothetical protein
MQWMSMETESSSRAPIELVVYLSTSLGLMLCSLYDHDMDAVIVLQLCIFV